MCNPEDNERVIMAYVSYFRGAKRKKNAPHPRHVPASANCSAEEPVITLGNYKPPPSTSAAGKDKGSARNKELVLEPRNIPSEVVGNRKASVDPWGKPFTYLYIYNYITLEGESCTTDTTRTRTRGGGGGRIQTLVWSLFNFLKWLRRKGCLYIDVSKW